MFRDGERQAGAAGFLHHWSSSAAIAWESFSDREIVRLN
jgi:hypothetical protein